MRDALTRLLYRHYPGLYRQAKLTMSQTSMCWGFSCHDGWFALIDALSETITAIDPECQAVQVKEKFGTLQFYFSGDHDLLYLTVGAAEFYSSRICERTGAPGDLMSTTSSWPLYATLSVEGIEQLNAAAGTTRVFKPVAEEMRLEPGTLPSVEIPQLPAASARASWSQAEAITILRKRHEHTLGARSIIDIPKGGFDLADTVMLKIYRRFRCDNSPGGRSIPKILRLIWGDAAGMSVKIDEASLAAVATSEIDSMSERRQHTEKPILETEIAKLRRSLAGVCLFANNMSKRIDPSTGRTGPVDDDGRLRF
jgi:hypothetical protein